jgi:hypothetical protein
VKFSARLFAKFALRSLIPALFISGAAVANPTSCAVAVTGVGSCAARLNCPFTLSTTFTASGSISGQVTYSYNSESCTVTDQFPSPIFRPFACALNIATIGPHQITANFVGSNGAANVSCSTIFQASPAWVSFIVTSQNPMPFVVGTPGFTIRAQVGRATDASVNQGQVDVVAGDSLSSSLVVGTGVVSSTGLVDIVINPLVPGVSGGVNFNARLHDDPNAMFGASNTVRIPYVSAPPVPLNGIIIQPQSIFGNPYLEQVGGDTFVVGDYNLQAPAQIFLQPAAFFPLYIDSDSYLPTTDNGALRSVRVPLSPGRHSILMRDTEIANPLVIYTRPGVLQVNSGGFE